MAIRLERAVPADAAALTAQQVRAFDQDVQRYPGVAPPGGPPGYDDAAWQIARMAQADYFEILEDDALVGGAIVFRMAAGHRELGRIWIDPDRQGRGLGGEALRLLEQAFPDARRWTLDTPVWASRNQAFYERHGYRRVREGPAHGQVLVFYEKVVGSPGAAG